MPDLCGNCRHSGFKKCGNRTKLCVRYCTEHGLPYVEYGSAAAVKTARDGLSLCQNCKWLGYGACSHRDRDKEHRPLCHIYPTERWPNRHFNTEAEFRVELDAIRAQVQAEKEAEALAKAPRRVHHRTAPPPSKKANKERQDKKQVESLQKTSEALRHSYGDNADNVITAPDEKFHVGLQYLSLNNPDDRERLQEQAAMRASLQTEGRETELRSKFARSLHIEPIETEQDRDVSRGSEREWQGGQSSLSRRETANRQLSFSQRDMDRMVADFPGEQEDQRYGFDRRHLNDPIGAGDSFYERADATARNLHRVERPLALIGNPGRQTGSRVSSHPRNTLAQPPRGSAVPETRRPPSLRAQNQPNVKLDYLDFGSDNVQAMPQGTRNRRTRPNVNLDYLDVGSENPQAVPEGTRAGKTLQNDNEGGHRSNRSRHQSEGICEDEPRGFSPWSETQDIGDLTQMLESQIPEQDWRRDASFTSASVQQSDDNSSRDSTGSRAASNDLALNIVDGSRDKRHRPGRGQGHQNQRRHQHQ